MQASTLDGDGCEIHGIGFAGTKGRPVCVWPRGGQTLARQTEEGKSCTSWRPSSRRWRRPRPPSISANRRPTSSCFPSPTAISRRSPPPGSSEAGVAADPTARQPQAAAPSDVGRPLCRQRYRQAPLRHRALPRRSRLLALWIGAHRRRRARERHPVRGLAGRRSRRSAARRVVDRAAEPLELSTATSAKAGPRILAKRCARRHLAGRANRLAPPAQFGPVSVLGRYTDDEARREPRWSSSIAPI